mmetsp:Transcript_3616/g.6869  ORF Transcript_3616/g.6869 Transcript_3616/m.6869 type:complete len:114 (+) Transcript_3616:1904-2245(+)
MCKESERIVRSPSHPGNAIPLDLCRLHATLQKDQEHMDISLQLETMFEERRHGIEYSKSSSGADEPPVQHIARTVHQRSRFCSTRNPLKPRIASREFALFCSVVGVSLQLTAK